MTNSYTLELGPHPAKARHPATGEMLIKDGKPVPQWPRKRAAYLDGKQIAYIDETGAIAFLRPESRLGPIADEVIELAKKEFPHGGETSSFPVPIETESEAEADDDEDNDEE